MTFDCSGFEGRSPDIAARSFSLVATSWFCFEQLIRPSSDATQMKQIVFMLNPLY